MKGLVVTTKLGRTDSYTDNLSRHGNRTICEDHFVAHIELAFKEDKETIDNVGQKALRPHPNGNPSNPCPSKEAGNWQT